MSVTVEQTVVGLSLETPAEVAVTLQVGQGPQGAPPAQDVTSVTYDGLDRVTGYLLNGVIHTVTYPSATTQVDVGGGRTRTVTLDGSGRIVSAVYT